MAELKLPLFQTEGIPQMVEIWGDRCEALAADKQAESWISDYLGCLLYTSDAADE